MSNKAYIVAGYRVEDDLVPVEKLTELVEDGGLSIIVSTTPTTGDDQVSSTRSVVVGLIIEGADLGKSILLDPANSSKIESGYIKALTAKSGVQAQMFLVVGEKVSDIPTT